MVPALLMILVSAVASAAVEMLPVGETTVLIHTSLPTAEAALHDAARADAVLVALPAPGLAVLHGDAARIRRALGLAINWQGRASCSARP